MNNACLAYVLANEPDEAESLKDAFPSWAVIVGITGGHILPRERVEAQESDIRDIAQQFGLKMVPVIQGCRGGELLELILRPSTEPYWKLRYKGGSQEVFFLTTLARTPGYVTTMYSVANEQQYPAPDIGVYIQPVHQGVGCHCEFILPFNRKNRAETLIKEIFDPNNVMNPGKLCF
jgi:hypothetical protein